MINCQALWYVGRQKVELRNEQVPPPSKGEALVKAHYSGISRGTERLIFNGQVPQSEYERMRCPMQAGAFPFPVKYGYALTGEVVEGPSDLIGKFVFALHPHQELACIKEDNLHQIPKGTATRRASLAANMETAVNVIWDAELKPNEDVLIIGGGILGLLIARLIVQADQNQVTVADPQATRAQVIERLGALYSRPENIEMDYDVIIHTSATENGLMLALNHAAPDGRIVEASWFGDKVIALPLGETFHSRRLRLISSQVGAIPPSQRAKWSPTMRIQKALDHLNDELLDALITNEIDFSEAPERIPGILSGNAAGLMTILRYT